jgi:DNA-binding NarL/FixJ family response regulator
MARRVVIVDDHASFRGQARAILEDAGFIVVGEAATGATALEIARQVRPDLILLDILLPDMSGFDVATVLAATPDAPAVVLISSRDPEDYGRRIARSSAVGFVPKAELSGSTLVRLLDERR